MKVRSIKTKLIKSDEQDLNKILKDSISTLKNNSIVAITSKIVAMCEGKISDDLSSKDELVRSESQFYIPKEKNIYNISLTITQDRLIPSAGIDESNSDGKLVMWPKDPYKSANEARQFLEKEFEVKNIGVIITDSTVNMLQWGTTGICIGFSGIEPLKDYRGEKDLFGKEMKVTTANIVNGLAASAVLMMGEGTEQTPIVIIEEANFVKFTNKDTSKDTVRNLRITKEEDLYSTFLDSEDWEKGGANR